MKQCPQCGAETNGGKFCSECGAPLTESEEKIDSTDTTGNYLAEQVEDAATGDNDSSATAKDSPSNPSLNLGSSLEKESKKKKFSTKQIVIAVVVLFIFFGAIGSCSNDDQASNDSSTSVSSSTTKDTSSDGTSSKEKEQVDTTELITLCDEAAGLDLTPYTAASAANYLLAVDDGKALLESGDYTTGEVTVAVQAIKTAKSSLVEKVQPVTLSGSGDDVVEVPSDLVVALVSATYSGGSNFVIKALDASMDSAGLLVNTIGAYSGTTLLGTSSRTAAFLEIKASGNWTITLSPLADAPVATSGQSFTGDQVVRIDTTSTTLSFTNNGDSNFVVKGIDDSGNIKLLVNEIGSYTGTVVNKDYLFLEVVSSGEWTVAW